MYFFTAFPLPILGSPRKTWHSKLHYNYVYDNIVNFSPQVSLLYLQQMQEVLNITTLEPMM